MGCTNWMGFVNSTKPGHEAQEKKGEQFPSSLWSWWSAFEDVSWSVQQLSTWQQGKNVPAAVMSINIITSHFFTAAKLKSEC